MDLPKFNKNELITFIKKIKSYRTGVLEKKTNYELLQIYWKLTNQK